MPLPIIPILLWTVGGGALIYKGAKAVKDRNEAKNLNEKAEMIISRAKESLEESLMACNISLKTLGNKKIFVADKSISRFITSFEKLKDFNSDDSSWLINSSSFIIDKQISDKTNEKNYCFSASGVNLDNAKRNFAEAKKIAEELKNNTELYNGIRKQSYIFMRLLIRLDIIFFPLVLNMETIISQKGDNYNEFNNEDKKTITDAILIVKTIKTVLKTSILPGDGKLNEKSEQVADEARGVIETFENGGK
jgi:hypothetical protein